MRRGIRGPPAWGRRQSPHSWKDWLCPRQEDSPFLSGLWPSEPCPRELLSHPINPSPGQDRPLLLLGPAAWTGWEGWVLYRSESETLVRSMGFGDRRLWVRVQTT